MCECFNQRNFIFTIDSARSWTSVDIRPDHRLIRNVADISCFNLHHAVNGVGHENPRVIDHHHANSLTPHPLAALC